MTAPPGGADLRSLLDRSAAQGIAAPITYHATCTEDALGIAVQAVRGCILPRRLTLTLCGVPVVELLAAGGRLLGLGQMSDDGLHGDHADAIVTHLRGCLNGAGVVSVHSAPLDGANDASQTGIAAGDLYTALGLAPLSQSQDARRDALLAAADDVLIAVLSASDPPEAYANLPPDVPGRVAGWLAPGGLAAGLRRGELMVFALNDPCLGIGLLCSGGTPEALIFDATACADLARFWSELPVMTGVVADPRA